MNETYTICFRIDYNPNDGVNQLVVLEMMRNGEPSIVNIIDDEEEVLDLYQRLTGREL